MKTQESYPLLIDEIFGNLEEASRIEIDLDANLLNNHGQQIGSGIVKSINGQYSAQRYLHYMMDIKAGILDNIRETLPQIAPFFYTDRQQNISPKSLRNSYDDPDIEILTQILQELKLWERYIEKFIERKTR
jgi:hypothetical protein